jgi:hypothetical protein
MNGASPFLYIAAYTGRTEVFCVALNLNKILTPFGAFAESWGDVQEGGV